MTSHPWLVFAAVLVTLLSKCDALLDLSENSSVDLDLSDFLGIQPGNINEDVDNILQKFGGALPSRVEIGTLDPNFAQNCFLTGLDNGVARSGNAFLELPDTKATFTVGLATNRLTIHCSWRKPGIFFHLRGTAHAAIDRLSVRTQIGFNLEPGAGPKVEDFRVTHLGRINTKITGFGLLDWIGGKVLTKAANVSNQLVKRAIEENVSKMLQESLDSFKLPALTG